MKKKKTGPGVEWPEKGCYRMLVLAAVAIPGAASTNPSRTPQFFFSAKLGSFENWGSTKVIASD